MTDSEEGLSPEERLEAPTFRLINAGIVSISDMETLRECIAYENTHRNRPHVLTMLKEKAEELQSNLDEGNG